MRKVLIVINPIRQIEQSDQAFYSKDCYRWYEEVAKISDQFDTIIFSIDIHKPDDPEFKYLMPHCLTNTQRMISPDFFQLMSAHNYKVVHLYKT
jgi:hypothetical protein